MGNTKTYYIEGELLAGTSIEAFKEAARDGFHFTYCVAEIVEEKGGYLGTDGDGGPYVVAAIHSYSMVGDNGPQRLFPIFKYFRMHRVDIGWADCWIAFYDAGAKAEDRFRQWRAHSSTWEIVPPEP